MKKRKQKLKELKFDEYAYLFSHYVQKTEKVDKHTYRGRCPICGDSKKIKSKKRFYLMRADSKRPCMIYCHNCGFKKSAYYFFEEKTPTQFKKLQKPLNKKDLENIKNLSSGKVQNLFYNDEEILEINPKDYENVLKDEVNKAKRVLAKFFYHFTMPVCEIPEAVFYLQKRNIPSDRINEMVLLRPEYHNSKTFRFAYFRDYILIPFIDQRDNGSYYFHARRYRNLQNRFARFLSCPYKPDNVEISFFLNEMRIDKSKPVFIAEGTLDALNLENAISVNGVKKITEEQIERFECRFGGRENIVYVLDNEIFDHDARKKAKELLKQHKHVFLWTNLAKDIPSVKIKNSVKDINDLCKKAKRTRLPSQNMLKYTSSNISPLL